MLERTQADPWYAETLAAMESEFCIKGFVKLEQADTGEGMT